MVFWSKTRRLFGSAFLLQIGPLTLFCKPKAKEIFHCSVTWTLISLFIADVKTHHFKLPNTRSSKWDELLLRSITCTKCCLQITLWWHTCGQRLFHFIKNAVVSLLPSPPYLLIDSHILWISALCVLICVWNKDDLSGVCTENWNTGSGSLPELPAAPTLKWQAFRW